MKASNFRILLVYPNIPMMLVTPLSIAIFTWILRQEGYEVELFDSTPYGDGDLSSPQNRAKYLQARNLFSDKNLKLLKSTSMSEDFAAKIKSFKPHLLLYSFTEDSFKRALELLGISNGYNIPTVVGGVLATSAPDWLIGFPEVPVLAIEEGEETVREIARRIFTGEDLADVPNLWIKQKNGSIKKNPARQYVSLDENSSQICFISRTYVNFIDLQFL